MVKFKLALIIIFFQVFDFSLATTCVCTTVPCPVVGVNYLADGGGTIGNYIYVKQGSQIVVTSASISITRYDLDKGTDTSSCTQSYSRLLDDDGLKDCDAGHILANRLGGPGKQPINIFPQDYSVNRGIYAQFENDIYDCIVGGAMGNLTWSFSYFDSNRTKPDSVVYTASFNNSGPCSGSTLTQTFPNISPTPAPSTKAPNVLTSSPSSIPTIVSSSVPISSIPITVLSSSIPSSIPSSLPVTVISSSIPSVPTVIPLSITSSKPSAVPIMVTSIPTPVPVTTAPISLSISTIIPTFTHSIPSNENSSKDSKSSARTTLIYMFIVTFVVVFIVLVLLYFVSRKYNVNNNVNIEKTQGNVDPFNIGQSIEFSDMGIREKTMSTQLPTFNPLIVVSK